MNNIMNSDILKINLGLFIIGSLIMSLVKKLRKLFSRNKKMAIGYAILILISFALVGFLSSSKVLNDTPIHSFYGFEILFFGLGVLHLYILRKYFPILSADKSTFFPEFLFTIAYTCLGLIAFLQVVSRLKPAFSYVFTTAAILFVLPLLFYKMYEFSIQIALPIYESWLYPSHKEIKDPTKEELANPRVISFEFRKKEDENDVTNFRVKAPQAMEFGKLFYFFIVDYNERHPESEIEILDESNKHPNAWVFHYKPNWWSPVRHVNFNQTVLANDIKEDTVIICTRVVNG